MTICLVFAMYVWLGGGVYNKVQTTDYTWDHEGQISQKTF